MAQFKVKFQAITKLEIPDQSKFFLNRFVFRLGKDRFKEVKDLEVAFTEFLKNDDGKANSMSPAVAADFMQKRGRTRTAMQRKAELADVDVNQDGRVSFIEYLILHYKVMILEEFFQRKGEAPDVDITGDGVGLTGVGDRLIEELFAPPAGLDPELEKMMKDFSLHHQTRVKEEAELEAQVAEGGVKGMGAKSKLETLRKADGSELHALEARIAAAIKKADKKAHEEVALREKELVDEAAAADAARKGGLSDKIR